jgi:hypothetical protein
MRRVCGHRNIGRCLSIEGIRDEISWVWDPTAYKAFLAMLTGLENPEAYFFSGNKVIFMENRGYNDLRRATEGGHDAAAYLYTTLLYRWCHRRQHREAVHEVGRGGGSMTLRWLSNEGFLPLREKAARAMHSSTWRIWGEPLPPPAHVRGNQPCAGNDSVDKGWLRISLYCSEDCRLRCEMVKLARSIRVGNQ